MTREPWRYLRWWVSDQHQTDGPLLLLGPFLLVIGPVLVVDAATASDFRAVLGGVAFSLVGLYLVFFPVFEYRSSSRSSTRSAEDERLGTHDYLMNAGDADRTEDDTPLSSQPGPTSARTPVKRESFGEKFPPYEVFPFVAVVFAGLFIGSHLAVEDGTIPMRLLGLGLVAGSFLTVASYALKFFPEALRGERWSRTLPRRVARLALKHAWGAIFLSAAIVGFVLKIVD